MGRWGKMAVVLAGYVASVAAGGVAAWLYDIRVSALPIDTSGGMYAGGQLLSALAVFLVASLVPTLLALWFLRLHQPFWKALAVASIAFAGAGLLAVLMPLVVRDTSAHWALQLADLLGLAQLLGVPLWLVGFVLFASLAPSREARRMLLVAAGIELVIAGCALVHWFVPRPPL